MPLVRREIVGSFLKLMPRPSVCVSLVVLRPLHGSHSLIPSNLLRRRIYGRMRRRKTERTRQSFTICFVAKFSEAKGFLESGKLERTSEALAIQKTSSLVSALKFSPLMLAVRFAGLGRCLSAWLGQGRPGNQQEASWCCLQFSLITSSRFESLDESKFRLIPR